MMKVNIEMHGLAAARVARRILTGSRARSLVMTLLLATSLSAIHADDVALRSGDQLSIRLAGVPSEDINQVSGAYTVDGGGNINLPYIGKIHAAGLRQADVQNSIENAYKVKGVYSSPIVTVSVQFDRLVDLEGDVRSPQRVRYTPDLTLLGAISAAGGFTDFADQTKVSILRNGSRTFVNVKKVRQNIEADPALQPGDKISVPRSFW
jgi:protein involved in polysaccharide export with SLBB domain